MVSHPHTPAHMYHECKCAAEAVQEFLHALLKQPSSQKSESDMEMHQSLQKNASIIQSVQDEQTCSDRMVDTQTSSKEEMPGTVNSSTQDCNSVETDVTTLVRKLLQCTQVKHCSSHQST